MILITTPNGNVGSEVVKQLQAEGAPFKVGAHTAQKAQAAFPGTTVVHFDYGDEASVRAALQGVEKLFLASPGGMPAEPVNRAVDLAKEAGVQHVVRLTNMSVGYTDEPALRESEQHIEASGLAWTFLRPNWFMQNYATMNAEAVRGGVFHEPAAAAATSFVDTRDIAAVAVAALTEEGHAGQTYTITGPEALTRDQVARKLSAATGRDVQYQPLSAEQFGGALRGMGAPGAMVDHLNILYGFVRGGQTAPVSGDVQRVTGRAPTSFERFAHDHVDAWR